MQEIDAVNEAMKAGALGIERDLPRAGDRSYEPIGLGRRVDVRERGLA
jgi:hypothetical protein